MRSALAGLAIGAFLAGGSPVLARDTSLSAAPTMSVQAVGACTDSASVTVVVDFTDLGGGIVTRCVGWPVSTGYQALTKAGFSVVQPVRSPGFVCRINGQPTSATEKCIDTPPTSAYWAYWYAPNHGSWSYSTTGAWSHQPIKGGYEGWAFEKGRSTAVPPRVSPSHSVLAPPAPSSTPASHPPATTKPPTSAKSQPGTASARAPRASSHATTGTSTKKAHKRRKAPQADNPTTGEEVTSSAPTKAAAGDKVTSTASETAQHDSSSPLATIAGAGLVALLAAAGGFVAWRRRAGGP